MNRIMVDARGLDCPQPVILTREALSRPGAQVVHIMVDDAVQSENVGTMARNQGWDIRIERDDADGILLEMKKAGVQPSPAATDDGGESSCGVPTRLVVQIGSDRFGSGDDELGGLLMRSFLKTLREIVPRPASIIFVNSGVKLTIIGSECAADIRQLEKAGVDIINCGTCLDFFGLKDKLEAGRISNMFEIVDTLAAADRVIKP